MANGTSPGRALLQRVLESDAPWDSMDVFHATEQLQALVDRGTAVGASLHDVTRLRALAQEARTNVPPSSTLGKLGIAKLLEALARALEAQRQAARSGVAYTPPPRDAAWYRNETPAFITMYAFDPTHRVEFHGAHSPSVWVVAPEIPGGMMYLGTHPGNTGGAYQARRLLQLATGVSTGTAALTLDADWFGDPTYYERAREQIAQVQGRAR